MYYKVYAQSCAVAQPIKKITEFDLDKELRPLLNVADTLGLVDDFVESQEIAERYLDEVEIISCGNYCIVKQDDVPQERPKVCGYDTHIFKS